MFCRKQGMKAVLIAVSACISMPVLAQTAAQEVRTLNEEMAVLTAKFKKLEVEAKVEEKRAAMRRSDSPTAGDNSSAKIEFAKSTAEMPVVKAIEGVDGLLFARLAMRGGMEQTIKVGEKFGVWTTKEISVNSVTFANGKETVRVPFGNEPPAAELPNRTIPSFIGTPAGIPSPPTQPTPIAAPISQR